MPLAWLQSRVLLAAVASTLLVVGDRMVDAWTSGGLLLALRVMSADRRVPAD